MLKGTESPEYTSDQGRLSTAGVRHGLMTGHKNAHHCIKLFSETDFTEDLKKITVPTLIIHDDDQIVRNAGSALLAALPAAGSASASSCIHGAICESRSCSA